MNETVNNNVETSQTHDDGPWGKSYQETVPPFNSGEKQIESEEDKYYFDEHGVERRDLGKIDISTEEGKYDYIASLVEERQIDLEQELDDAKENNDEEEILRIEDELAKVQKQRKIVQGIDLSNGRSAMESLNERSQKEYKLWDSQDGTPESRKLAEAYTHEANDLIGMLSREMADRDPAYFGIDNMTTKINNSVRRAAKNVEATLLDKETDELGQVRYLSEKKPSSMTPDAEMDLKETEAEAKVFQELVDDYRSEHDYDVSDLMSKAEFRSRIEREIMWLTAEIDRAKEALKIAKEKELQDHEGYNPLTETRDHFVQKRKALKRLLEKYF